jgi:hypothetical protein
MTFPRYNFSCGSVYLGQSQNHIELLLLVMFCLCGIAFLLTKREFFVEECGIHE